MGAFLAWAAGVLDWQWLRKQCLGGKAVVRKAMLGKAVLRWKRSRGRIKSHRDSIHPNLSYF